MSATPPYQEFLNSYYKDEIGQLAVEYPERSSLWIDHADLYQFNADLAIDLIENPDQIIEGFEDAVPGVDIPVDVTLDGVTVRVYNLSESNIVSPGELRTDHADEYKGVKGVLDRVTTTSDLPERICFNCKRCGSPTYIEQSVGQDDMQEPHECSACERQGPFEIESKNSEWSDYAKLRVKSPPDTSESKRGQIEGYVLNELIDYGAEKGLIERAGEPVTIYGKIERVQKSGRGENSLLFDHFVQVRAVEFDRDDETVDVEEHKDEFQRIAAEPDAVDKFAESIAPNLHVTDAWNAAMEFAVAYLFGAPRINIPKGPTYRGDLHFLIISDYGMGKSDFSNDIEAYSPKCIKKSTTALSSGVGLTAAAVEDDFGEGAWTIKPGLLVRANGGHLILDEIDKGPDELTDMNDALEGEQVVDVEKAGKSVTYDSKTAVMALGNPVDGRFDQHEAINEQLGISESLLSRFDGIVTMEDQADEEQDKAIAETFGKAYTEAQQAEYDEETDLEILDREVPVDVGQAWVKYARENINPILSYEQFQELEDWYASEVRQLNHTFGSNEDGADMPVPATVRVIGSVVKMSIAFARARLQAEVQPQQIERAKKLGKQLVKNNWNGENFDASGGASAKSGTRKKVMDALSDKSWQFPELVAREAGVNEAKAMECLKKLNREYNPPKVEEKKGKYRKA
jgi:replicative DNA helicase Mcm